VRSEPIMAMMQASLVHLAALSQRLSGSVETLLGFETLMSRILHRPKMEA
jgi:hypothetical protein